MRWVQKASIIAIFIRVLFILGYSCLMMIALLLAAFFKAVLEVLGTVGAVQVFGIHLAFSSFDPDFSKFVCLFDFCFEDGFFEKGFRIG